MNFEILKKESGFKDNLINNLKFVPRKIDEKFKNTQLNSTNLPKTNFNLKKKAKQSFNATFYQTFIAFLHYKSHIQLPKLLQHY